MTRKNLEENIIDKYYDEKFDNKIIEKNLSEAKDLEEKLKKLTSTIEINEDKKITVNILEGILKGEEIKNKRKEKIELLMFLCICISIIAGAAVTSIIFPNLIKIYFTLAVIISPFVLVFISIKQIKGSESNG
ncbi:MAG: hypothetical protein KID00_04480 [Clostridium argentinense]|uniref:YxlC family protein n=1 Tax=Clostridium faecium TaxID=2762223 RepID=A0ABR8YQ92_9CLOT|nr:MULTISPECIES: hypothetical protein [Clostridium]MBD8046424.1 hypothetical protein [Clostridium faecium]MBS5823112.1 hypothetical protein [Clostridium argentinense]